MVERSLLLSVLPWTALGLQAWWLCLLQSAAVWLILRWRGQHSRAGEALPISLLLLALGGALSHFPDLRSAALIFVVTGPLALALGAGIAGLLGGQRWALIFPASALLLGPTVPGLLALLVGALGTSGPETRGKAQALRPLAQAPRSLVAGWLLGAAVLVAAFALLPRPALPHLDRTPIDVVEQVRPPAAGPSAPRTGTRTQRGQPAARVPRPDAATDTLLDAAALPLLGIALLCLAILRRSWGRWGGRFSPLATLLAGALLAATALFILGLLLQPEAVYRVVKRVVLPPAVPEAPAAGGSPMSRSPAAGLALPSWLIWGVSVLGLLLFSGAAWLVVRLKELPENGPDDAGPAPSVPVETEGPPGRVRAAYAATLRLLAGRGLSRAESETPDELLARAAARWPELGPALSRLTAAYRPVRYGGALDEAQAEAAEHSAAEVHSLLQDSPHFFPERQP